MIYTNSYFKLLAVISVRRGISCPVTCKRLSWPLFLPRPSDLTLRRLISPSGSIIVPWRGPRNGAARIVFARSVQIPSVLALSLSLSLSLSLFLSLTVARLFARSLARAGIYYRFVRASRSEMETARRTRERESRARAGLVVIGSFVRRHPKHAGP